MSMHYIESLLGYECVDDSLVLKGPCVPVFSPHHADDRSIKTRPAAGRGGFNHVALNLERSFRFAAYQCYY